MIKLTTLATAIVFSSILLTGCGDNSSPEEQATAKYNKELEQQNKVRNQIK